MTEAKSLPPDTIYLGTLRAGTKISALLDGRLVAAHPEEPVMLITPEGLVPFNTTEVELADDFKITVSIAT